MALLLELAMASSDPGAAVSMMPGRLPLRHGGPLERPRSARGTRADSEQRRPRAMPFMPSTRKVISEAAAALRVLGPIPVIGIRSIGTGLAALVAAALGAKPPVTVRPTGHPFRREVSSGPSLHGGAYRGSHAPYAIVDEGPGLSGSSFGAVADWLEARGVAGARAHSLLPEPRRATSARKPAPCTGTVGRRRGAIASRWTNGCSARPTRPTGWRPGSTDLVGPLDAPLEDRLGRSLARGLSMATRARGRRRTRSRNAASFSRGPAARPGSSSSRAWAGMAPGNARWRIASGWRHHSGGCRPLSWLPGAALGAGSPVRSRGVRTRRADRESWRLSGLCGPAPWRPETPLGNLRRTRRHGRPQHPAGAWRCGRHCAGESSSAERARSRRASGASGRTTGCTGGSGW